MTDTSTQRLSTILKPYQKPSTRRGILELLVTLVPLVTLWTALYVCVAQGWWWGLLLSVPAGLFLVRLFMIQHDCGHQAFFPGKAANTWLGRIAGVLTMTPYDYWRRTHAIHHATSGDLDRRGLGAIEMLTVEEYRALPFAKRLAYRIYRNPIVLLGLGPAYMFVLQHRVPIGTMREGWAWKSVIGNNLGLVLLCGVLIALVGPRAFLIAHLPVVVIAATVGVLLFYVQHQFEGTYWARRENWNADQAAMAGSSYLKLPAVLQWLTAHIGAHHIHHASSRVPFYRLPEVLRREPAFAAVPRVDLRQSLRALTLALWDEQTQRLVRFRDAGRR